MSQHKVRRAFGRENSEMLRHSLIMSRHKLKPVSRSLLQHKKGKQNKSYVVTLETYVVTKNIKHDQENS